MRSFHAHVPFLTLLLLLLLLTPTGGARGQGMGHGDGPSTAIAPSIPPGIRTPSGFVENIGQIVDRGGARRPDILYALSDGPTAIFLRRGAISYVLHGVPAGSDRGMCGYRMDVELVGADPAARVTAEEPTGGWSSYYRGGAEGATRLPRFRRVVYHDIYPGIDMAFSHDSSGVKYDFIVHPGGDPGNIALRYIGADSLVREPSGMLNAAVPLGVLREGAPFTYQPAGGNARPDDGDARLRVPCEYLVGGDMVRFSLGAYDRRATLVIDPTLAWATYCGGIRAEALDVKGTDLIVDAAGNVLMITSTFSTDFPLFPATLQPSNGGGEDACIIKLTGAGVPLWSTYIGGSGTEKVGAIASSGIDRVAICGYTNSTDFPVATPRVQAAPSGGFDMFVALFDGNGTRLWATYCGGSSDDYAHGIDIDPNGDVVIAGTSYSPDMPVPGALQRTRSGVADAYVAKLNAAGTMQWGTYFGGTQVDEGWGVTFDQLGAVAFVGSTASPDLTMVPSSWMGLYNGGATDAFIAELTPAGGLSWSTFFGGTLADVGTDIDAEAGGGVVVCGYTLSLDFPISPAAFQGVHLGTRNDAFVARFDAQGQRRWATYFGGRLNGGPDGADDRAYAVCTAPNGDVYFTGFAASPDFPTHPFGYQINLLGQRNAYLAELDGSGTFLWSTYYSGTAVTEGYGVGADSVGNAYIAGKTNDGLTGTGRGFQPAYAGGSDAFIAKFSGFCYPMNFPITVTGSLTLCPGGSVTLTAAPGYTYAWPLTRETTRSITATAPGRYTVVLTDANGCTGSSSVEVVLKPSPSLTAFGPTTFCEGDSVKLDAEGDDFVSYRWSTGETTPAIWAKRNGAYTVEVVDVDGCRLTASGNITVFPVPTRPDLAPTDTLWLCPDSLLVLDAGTNSRYDWSTGARGQRLVVTDSGRYFVKVTNAAGCSAISDTVTVRMYGRPRVGIRALGPLRFCEGDSVILEATGGPFASYRWSTLESSSRIVARKAGLYNVRVKTPEGCGADTSILVDVVPAPDAAIRGPQAVCVDARTSYRAPGDDGVVYRWKLDGDGTIVTSDEGPGIVVQWGAVGIGTITLTATDTLHGCTATFIRKVTIGTDLKPVIVPRGPTVFCAGGYVLLDVGSGMMSYAWSTGDSASSIIVTEPGSYTVSVVDSGGCRGTSDPLEVRVIARPDPVISGPAKVCLNSDAVYTVADVPGDSYDWSVTGGTIIAGPGTSSITVRWGGSGAGTVDLFQESGVGACRVAAERFDVAIGTELQPSVTPGGSLTLCDGDSVILDAGSGYADYLWSSGERSRVIVVKRAGSYSVTVTDAGGCSGASKPVGVVMAPRPIAVVTALGPTTLCAGDEVVLDAGGGAASYRWSTGETSRTIAVRAAGSYSVTVTSVEGCRAASSPLVVTVLERPSPAISGPIKVCLNSTASYTAPSLPGHGYRWTVGGGTIVSGQGTARIDVRWGGGGVGSVDLTETGAGGTCATDARRYDVAIGTELEPVVSPAAHVDLCAGDSAELDAGDGYTRYEWSTGETSRRIIVRESGSYTVRAWDAGGCNGVSSPVEVEVHRLPIPAITPSGPVTIAAGDGVELDAGGGYAGYRWSTGDTTRRITVTAPGEYSVRVVDRFGCAGEAPAVVVDLVSRPAGEAVVGLPEVEAVPGERITVPLVLRSGRNMPSGAIDFHARLRYHSALLFPVGSTPSGTIDGSDRVLDLRGTLTGESTGGTMLELTFLALLGDTDVTPLKLESLVWSDTSIATALRDGLFHLKGLCVAGPTRLVGESGLLALKQVRPNPASDRCEVEYELIEDGRTRLEIADMIGRSVAVIADGQGAPGRYVVSIDVTALPAGAYILKLQTPTRRLSLPMRIER